MLAKKSVAFPANDRVQFYTDRTLYVAGESVSFSALITNENGIASAVLYVEVITSEGYRLTWGKYPIKQGKSIGELVLPKDILSGVYFIKAYTKWMRNFNPMDYSFIQIKVVNPYLAETLRSANKQEQMDAQNHNDIASTIDPDVLKIGKKGYSTREKGDLSIFFNPLTNGLNSTAILSIVPDGAVNSYFKANSLREEQVVSNVQFLPETIGITISGRVVDKSSSAGVPFATVNLSLLGNNPDFMSAMCDENGVFNLTPPLYYMRREMFIGTEERSDITTQIKIDLDYCTRELFLPFIPFSLSEKERVLALQFARNLQVDSIFFSGESIRQNAIQPNRVAFYGTPDNSITFDKYVNLLSLEEYFLELIPQVAIRGSKGRRKFKFQSPINDMNVYDPLVLIDFIAVDWADRILSVSPTSISKIDIVNKPYFKGDRTFGGIISFYSKKGDMAGIELPSSGMFFGYDFFNKPSSTDASFITWEMTQPDTRNTVLWLPEIVLKEKTVQRISFISPETPGEYRVVLKIISPLGEKTFTDTFFVK
jgi:hypothetical protein